MVSRTKRSVNEANSRSSDVEASNLQKQMCETRDLGIMWPHRHALIFEGVRRIDMRYVCPKDVKKMFCGGPGQSIGRSGQQSMNMKN